MTKPNRRPADAAALRRRAEAQAGDTKTSADPLRTEVELQRLLHELQVQQIELEMQNEELQRARNVIEAEREEYADLYDFAPVGYLTLDRAGVIQRANLASAKMVGIERARLTGQAFSRHVAAEDQAGLGALVERVWAGQVRPYVDLSLVPGHAPRVAVRMEAALDHSGQEVRLILVDVTGRKRAEEDRLMLNKLESAGILAGGIAHDFNNLLTVILLDIEQAQTHTMATGEGGRSLAEAKKAALSARSLTQQLITFARGGAPVRRPTRLAAITRESVRLPLSGSNVRCELSLPADLWCAEVDEGQIGQVIRNLVLNAREAMPRGGVIAVRAENVSFAVAEHPQLAAGDYVRLSVTDDGIGMSPEVLGQIFDPYFSTKQRGSEKGTGLGLTICHSIIRKHGGALEVTSRVGTGSTFVVHLPACGPVTGASPGVDAMLIAAPCRILVMDDEEPIRNVVGLTLRQAGHEVDLVAEGQSAIDAYHQARAAGRPFDLVFLDLTVRAGLGGQDTMDVLRKFDPKVKCIVMSGYGEDRAVRDPGCHGFVDMLAKPFDGHRLRAVVNRVMGRRQEAPITP